MFTKSSVRVVALNLSVLLLYDGLNRYDEFNYAKIMATSFCCYLL